MKAARANLAVVGTEGMRSTEALVTVTAAQVHATLALVEQQRIANMLLIAHWVSDEHLGRKLDDLRMGVAGEVWEGLGL